MRTVHRIITLDGPDDWVEQALQRSLPDGPAPFANGSGNQGKMLHCTVLPEAGAPPGKGPFKMLTYCDPRTVQGVELPEWRCVLHWRKELDPVVDVRSTTKEQAERRALIRLKYLAYDAIRFAWDNREKLAATDATFTDDNTSKEGG
jgi:hypothetical protein